MKLIKAIQKNEEGEIIGIDFNRGIGNKEDTEELLRVLGWDNSQLKQGGKGS